MIALTVIPLASAFDLTSYGPNGGVLNFRKDESGSILISRCKSYTEIFSSSECEATSVVTLKNIDQLKLLIKSKEVEEYKVLEAKLTEAQKQLKFNQQFEPASVPPLQATIAQIEQELSPLEPYHRAYEDIVQSLQENQFNITASQGIENPNIGIYLDWIEMQKRFEVMSSSVSGLLFGTCEVHVWRNIYEATVIKGKDYKNFVLMNDGLEVIENISQISSCYPKEKPVFQ
jgi:uncharacterized protein YjhX (UPF0386 family)